MDNQEDGPMYGLLSIASIFARVRLVESARTVLRRGGWSGRDYYFNSGLIWRGAHKSDAEIGKTISYGASIAAPNIYSKYILLSLSNKYMTNVRNTYIHTHTQLSSLTRAISRTPVETVHCTDVRPVRYCRLAYPRSSRFPISSPSVCHCEGVYARLRVYIRLSSAIYSRATMARGWLYTTRKRARARAPR